MHTVNESRAQGCDIKAMEMPEYLFLGPVHCTRTEILLVQDCCVRKNGYADVISFLPREANGKLIFSASKFPTDVVFIEAQQEPAEIHCSIGILEEIGHRFPGLVEARAHSKPSAKIIFTYKSEPKPKAEYVIHCTRTEILLVQDCCVRKNGYADVISFLPREANGKLIFSASKFPTDVVFVEAQEEPAEIHCSISILEEIGYRFPGLIKTHAQARPSAIVHFVYHAERTFEAELSCSNDERFD